MKHRKPGVSYRKNLVTATIRVGFVKSGSAIRYQIGDVKLPAKSLFIENIDALLECKRSREVRFSMLPTNPHDSNHTPHFAALVNHDSS